MKYYIGTDLKRSFYISHYGVPGQKWGVRRYQDLLDAQTERQSHKDAIANQRNRSSVQGGRSRSSSAAVTVDTDASARYASEDLQDPEAVVERGRMLAKKRLELLMARDSAISSRKLDRLSFKGRDELMNNIMALRVANRGRR